MVEYLFAEIRLREIRCDVEVARESCALFAKAKVDAQDWLEFTGGSRARGRCRSLTTADTRECLEILVFLFLVTSSLSLSLSLSIYLSLLASRSIRPSSVAYRCSYALRNHSMISYIFYRCSNLGAATFDFEELVVRRFSIVRQTVSKLFREILTGQTTGVRSYFESKRNSRRMLRKRKRRAFCWQIR